MSSKYEPLAAWLVAQPEATVTMALTFADVERVLGGPLPSIAAVNSAWWTTIQTRYPHVEAWRSVGWEVAALDRGGRVVTFARIRGA